jgi:conjugative relaxase-like TrwC/TraI family protein
MMTTRVVHAGSGYRYLLRSVATNDADPDHPEQPEQGDRLHNYYQAKGTPPGKWIGSGLPALESANVVEGEQITEDQMAALYGEGLHPDADEKIAAGDSVKSTKLGRSFALYTGGQPVLEELAAVEKQFRKDTDRRPDESERFEIALRVGAHHFTDAHNGRVPRNNHEIVAWVNKVQDTNQQAVAGYDLTFSPVKSVSTLWGLADRDTANKIATAHHEAVAEALGWVEDQALFTRIGVNGIQQVKTDGLVASEFTHFDTRGGDPDLHSHVLVSNKVRVADTDDARKADKVGAWRTVDGQQVFEHMHSASGVYNTALQQRLSDSLGLEFEAVETSADKEPVWEVKGVPTKLNKEFSKRRELTRPIFDQMVADYVGKHHRQPSRRAVYSMWQTAILETRDAKKPADSLDTLRSQWRATANEVVGENVVDNLFGSATSCEVTRPEFSDDAVDRIAAKSIRAVLTRRASFKRSHVHTAVSQQLRGYRFTDNDQRQAAYTAVMHAALDEQSVCLTPPETLELPDKLTTETGVGIDRKNNSEIYSTTEQLRRESSILAAADKPQAAFVKSKKIDRQLRRFTKDKGFSLNDGQEQMARHFLTVGTQLAVAVGPAGTGKTTGMEVVAESWKKQNRNVIGLAPSAVAATILQHDIGTEAFTVDKLTYWWNQSTAETPAEKLDALPVSIKRNDMLLVDEAGMVATDNMATLVEIADASGAVIRMVGDPAQLDAVETGGVFRTLAASPAAPKLNEVLRMGDDKEQAAATLQIRDGNTDGLQLYHERGWVKDGSRDEMIVAAVEGYFADTNAGLRSLVIAPTNDDVRQMNEMMQAELMGDGVVDVDGPSTTLSDGIEAHVGDTVLARQNKLIGDKNNGVRVLNGQILQVRQINEDGSLNGFDPRSRKHVHLPADYVSESTQLGYAATFPRTQGATVDTTHSLVDQKLDRNGMYVGLTRGKSENRVYVDTSAELDTGAEDGHVHHSGDEAAPTAEEILTGIVEHDHSQRSALDELEAQMDEADSPERTTALYREGVARATGAFAHQVTDELVDNLPALHAGAIQADEDGYTAIEHAATYAANNGVDVRELWLTAAEDIDWADSPGRLIASRLRNATDVHMDATDRLTTFVDGQIAVDDLDADGRYALDAAVSEAHRKGIDLDTVWDEVTHGVAVDEDAAAHLADNLTVITTGADDPAEKLDDWIDHIDIPDRVALRRSSVDHAALSQSLGEAFREGLDARELWIKGLTDADWNDTPAGDIAEVFNQALDDARQDRIDDTEQQATDPNETPDTAQDAKLPLPPPVIESSDPELAVWLQTTHDELTADTGTNKANESAPDTAVSSDDQPETVTTGPDQRESIRERWKRARPTTPSRQKKGRELHWGQSGPETPQHDKRPDTGPGW